MEDCSSSLLVISMNKNPEVSVAAPACSNAAFIYSLEQSGTCQLYSPDRAAHIKWALCLDKGRGLTAEDPYVRVRRLLAHQTRQKPSDASDFHFHNIVHGFMREPSNHKRFLALREDRKLDEPRFWRGRHH